MHTSVHMCVNRAQRMIRNALLARVRLTFVQCILAENRTKSSAMYAKPMGLDKKLKYIIFFLLMYAMLFALM